MSVTVKAGTRLLGATCTTEMIVVKATAHDLEIFISKATTVLDQAADTFYVKTADQKRLLDRERVAALRRDLLLGLRRGADSLQPLLFFVIALALFPLGVGPAPEVLARIGIGVIWGLVELVLAAVAGAWLYQEPTRSPVRATA